ncbi:MAG: alpha/beta fold hydrolase [Gaiellaceae bacterium]
MPDLHVETIGTGPRVVFVHGSGSGGREAWSSQLSLAERFTLVIPTRSGYPPNPPLARIDFEQQAEELAPLLKGGGHLVGHSYGGVISLLIAARRPDDVRSLAVSEPPAFGLARADPAVGPLVADFERLWAAGLEPEPFLRAFLRSVGSNWEPPSPLPPEVEQGTRATQAERGPWEAEIPLERLAMTTFPKLVLSGAHHPAFDAVCDVLERRLGAARAVVPGAGHSIPRAPGYNERLAGFLDAA